MNSVLSIGHSREVVGDSAISGGVSEPLLKESAWLWFPGVVSQLAQKHRPRMVAAHGNCVHCCYPCMSAGDEDKCAKYKITIKLRSPVFNSDVNVQQSKCSNEEAICAYSQVHWCAAMADMQETPRTLIAV